MAEPVYVKVTAKPNAKEDSVTEKNGRYIVSTREPAEGGRANAAVRTLVARHLGVPESALSLVRGADKPSKIFIKRA